VNPEWHWKAFAANGGILFGSCQTAEELAIMVKKMTDIENTERVTIQKFRRDYDPMISPNELMNIRQRFEEWRSKHEHGCAALWHKAKTRVH